MDALFGGANIYAFRADRDGAVFASYPQSSSSGLRCFLDGPDSLCYADAVLHHESVGISRAQNP